MNVTEEKLREIFSEVGEVLSLKLVFDRETGKPKGYGFCEYKDVQTAMSAMRNLNGYEINGRILRVDNAGAERQRMAEMGGGNIFDIIYDLVRALVISRNCKF
ncbi:unnamed protein product [Orchesella dallaii]|uniref:RRM domain-containing protein n=1 Tax=Orchesella dallaii TaxID=48710 RepID=A0ABP1S1M7_9HEXA